MRRPARLARSRRPRAASPRVRRSSCSTSSPRLPGRRSRALPSRTAQWSATIGRQIFDQMLARNANHIDGVLAANDGLAGAVVASLQAHSLNAIPLTGQDATPTGVQFILAGWQSGTVYKSVRHEANAAAAAAVAIIKHQKVPGVNGTVSGTKSVLLTPVWITKKNYKTLFSQGFLKRSQVCVGQYAKYCKYQTT